MSAIYHCHCPMHGDECEDGKDYTEDDAECAEIAAARYALFFAKRFIASATGVAYMFVTVTWGDGQSEEVRVDVKQDAETLWGWRVCGIARQ